MKEKNAIFAGSDNILIIMEQKTKHQLGKEHTTEKPKLLYGNEPFKYDGIDLGFNVMNYWRFQFSNLIDNLGFVAEFLIAQALGKEEPDNCNGWTIYDLIYKGKRIEVKATSYWQSWKKSHIISEQRNFSIRKTYVDYQNNKSEKARQNDIYIFCLDKGKDELSSNPLNLENWEFYVVPTKVINELFDNQKVLSLKKLKNIERYGKELTYEQIKEKVDNIIDNL